MWAQKQKILAETVDWKYLVLAVVHWAREEKILAETVDWKYLVLAVVHWACEQKILAKTVDWEYLVLAVVHWERKQKILAKTVDWKYLVLAVVLLCCIFRQTGEIHRQNCDHISLFLKNMECVQIKHKRNILLDGMKCTFNSSGLIAFRAKNAEEGRSKCPHTASGSHRLRKLQLATDVR
jgi:hypothetical protein